MTKPPSPSKAQMSSTQNGIKNVGTSMPQIRINHSYLLNWGVSPLLAKAYGQKYKEISDDLHLKWVKQYRAAWQPLEQKLLEGMCQALGVAFFKPVIDVSLADYFIPQSDPIVLNYRDDADVFVDTLTHELIHVLLTDNDRVSIKDNDPKTNLLPEWEELFGKHDFPTLAHIPVHAVHKYIYLDILKAPARFERDVAACAEWENAQAYVDSWAYVNQHDYTKIIADLRTIYKGLAT